MRPISFCLASLWAFAVTSPVPAQSGPCPTYDRCALGIEEGFWGGTSIVQGAEHARLARLGAFAPSLPLLAERGDSVGRFYQDFRRKYNTGFWLETVGGLGIVAAGIMADRDRDAGLTIGVLVVGGGLAIWGAERRRSARNDLNRAIWWYNRTLTR